ncbi:MAG TPA: chorismate lyase [Noviherbaspirillum sp.]
MSLARARWCTHVNHVAAPPDLRGWLIDRRSLTAKLVAASERFRVRRLQQSPAVCLGDEYAVVALPRPQRVHQREVLLECDGRAVVYAHTILPLHANAYDWPFFATLGERSLGTTLFGDPRVVRGGMQYARLSSRHPLVRRAVAAGCVLPQVSYARRCLYRRRQGLLLVTELFLPAVLELRPGPQKESTQ